MSDFPIIWISEDGSAVQIGSTVIPRDDAIALARRLLVILEPREWYREGMRAAIVAFMAAIYVPPDAALEAGASLVDMTDAMALVLWQTIHEAIARELGVVE